MPGEHRGLVGQRQELGAQAGHHLLQRATGQVGAPDAALEQRVPGQHERRVLVGGAAEDHRAPGVAGGVVDGQGDAGEVECRPVGEGLDPLRLAERQARVHRGELGAHLADALEGVGEHEPVLGVDPGGDVVTVAHRRHRPHVVEVAVGQQHRHRRQPALGQDLPQRLLGVLSGVDHHARAALPGRDHEAVGLEGPGRESGEQHARPTLCSKSLIGRETLRPGYRWRVPHCEPDPNTPHPSRDLRRGIRGTFARGRAATPRAPLAGGVARVRQKATASLKEDAGIGPCTAPPSMDRATRFAGRQHDPQHRPNHAHEPGGQR